MLQQSRKHMKGGLGGAGKAIANQDGKFKGPPETNGT